MSNVIEFPEPPHIAARRVIYISSLLPYMAHGLANGLEPTVIASVMPTFKQFCACLDGKSAEEALGLEPLA